MSQQLEASFSTLVMSIGSSAALAMGLTPNPQTGKTEKDIEMAKFNIDLLDVLVAKTENNLNEEESEFLKKLTADLKMKFLEAKKA